MDQLLLLLEAQTEHERLKEGCAINQPFDGKLSMQLDSVHKVTAVAACAKESVAARFGHQATGQLLKLTQKQRSKRYRAHLLNLLCAYISTSFIYIFIPSRHLYATCLLGSFLPRKLRMLTEQATSGGLKAPMFRASKLTFLLKAPHSTDFNLMPTSP